MTLMFVDLGLAERLEEAEAAAAEAYVRRLATATAGGGCGRGGYCGGPRGVMPDQGRRCRRPRLSDLTGR